MFSYSFTFYFNLYIIILEYKLRNEVINMKFIFTDMEMITEISYSKSLDTVKGQPDISACMIHIRDDNNYPYNDFEFVGNEIEILGSYSNRCSKLVNSLYEPSDPKGIILLSKMIRNISFIVMGVRRIKLISKVENEDSFDIFISYKDHVYVDDSDSHSLIIGSSGSGKSFSFILPMLCLMAMTGESGLTVDIKGELSAKTAELFKSKGYDVYFIDFIDPENSDCWNPLYLGAKE